MTASNDDRERERVGHEWLALVRELLADREYEKASQAAACAVIDYPCDGRFWELGGLATWMDGQIQAAVLCLEEATVLKPLHPFAQVALADGYCRLGKKGLARPIWGFLAGPVGGRRLMGLFVEHPALIPDMHLGYRAFRTVTDHSPHNHHSWFGLGVALARLGGDRGRVAECLAVAVRLAPTLAPYRLALADAWLQAGETDRAVEVLDGFDPGRVACPCVLRWAGELFRRLGVPRRATECEERINELTRK